MLQKKVYLAGPISGLTFDESDRWRHELTRMLPSFIKTIWPMAGEDVAFGLGRLSDEQPATLLSNGKALLIKDEFYVREADMVVANFIGAPKISIGTQWECAWSFILRKPLCVIIDHNNINQHCFLREGAGWVVDNLVDARKIVTGILGAVAA